MGGEGREDPVGRLIDALRTAKDDRARLIALVWTWLDQYLNRDGVISQEAARFRKQAAESTEAVAIDEALFERIEQSAVRTAAQLLALLHADLARVAGTDLVELTRGIDGTPCFVVWRELPLAAYTHDPPPGLDRMPPRADEHPSLAALAPRLVVCPIEVKGIELDLFDPEQRKPEDADSDAEARAAEWRYARSLMANSLIGETSLDVHLDTLGEHGLTGLRTEDGGLQAFVDAEIDADDERACEAAVERAVRRAAKKASRSASPTPGVLLLPELAATANVMKVLVAELERQDHPPALTVVGLYHQPVTAADYDGRLVGDAQVPAWVNEAVVLGPTGVELWRHRKLSAAGDHEPDGEGGTKELQEAIVTGSRLLAVQTPIGIVSVVICLDVTRTEVELRLIESPTDLLLVPSLSPTTHRHQNSLQELTQKVWGMGFVCNRATKPDANGESVWNARARLSFWALQRKKLKLPRLRRGGEHPSFVFELSAYLPHDDDEEK